MSPSKSVKVQKLPERLTVGRTDRFLEEVKPMLEDDRPRVVFDFSEVRYFDSAGVAVLLMCIEEALKRNGDLKLASLPSASAALLRLTGIDTLFEIFDSVRDAVTSFHLIPGYEFQDAFEDATETFVPSVPVALPVELLPAGGDTVFVQA
jgi:anti-sigma B factor antagonist